jgi:hypothetical protein
MFAQVYSQREQSFECVFPTIFFFVRLFFLADDPSAVWQRRTVNTPQHRVLPPPNHFENNSPDDGLYV